MSRPLDGYRSQAWSAVWAVRPVAESTKTANESRKRCAFPPFRRRYKTQVLRLRWAPLRMTEWMGYTAFLECWGAVTEVRGFPGLRSETGGTKACCGIEFGVVEFIAFSEIQMRWTPFYHSWVETRFEIRGFPHLRQEKIARTGHGEFLAHGARRGHPLVS